MTASLAKPFGSKAVNFIFVLFIASDIFAGATRHYSSKYGFAELFYLPKALLVIAPFVIILARRRVNVQYMMLLAVILMSGLYGCLNFPSVYEAIFGVWVLVPFIYGFWASSEILAEAPAREHVFLLLFLVAALGVLFNTLHPYPWVGDSFNFAGAHLVAAKRLSYFGVKRYGGFALTSYNAAAEIICLAVWVVVYCRRPVLSLAVWILCGIAVEVTTTKGLFVSYVVLTLYFLAKRVFGLSKPWRIFWASVLVLLLCLDVGFPLYSLVNINPVLATSELEKVAFGTFYDRMNYTWPGSFSLLHSVWQWFVGRGIGGIGDAQALFEPASLFYGDNMFVYLSVEFGVVLTALFFGVLVFRSAQKYIRGTDHPLTIPFFILMISYGLVAPVVDWPSLAIIFGVVAAPMFSVRRTAVC